MLSLNWTETKSQKTLNYGGFNVLLGGNYLNGFKKRFLGKGFAE